MANLYQGILDEAAAKRRRLMEKGWEPSARLVEKVEAYKRKQQDREAEEAIEARKKRGSLG
ncbi:MAG: hypothetical protein ABFC67_14615 [Mizugakiibacter sp.]|uniref:hypothetical protein n=1 Tax=Mizugakiibacter sp. TaxID=1972610 RepID=UPI00320C6BB2